MLKWVFGADTSPFRRSLNEMRGDVKQFTASARTQLASMFGVGAVTAWVSATIDAAGRIDDLSKRLNMSAESFQRLSYASKLSGGDMETVGKSLTILTKNLEEAKKGGDGFSTAAKTLGVDLAALAAMAPEDQMIELSRGYQASADKGAALAAILKLLGKSGGEMVPMLAEGPGALAEMMDEASVSTNNQIASMAKLGDAMDAMKMKSVAALGDMIQGIQIWGAYAERFMNRYFDFFSGGNNAQAIFDEKMDKITGKGSGPNADAAAAAEESAKVEKEMADKRKKLVEDIAKLEEEARIRALSLAEKILDAEERRAVLAADSSFLPDENERLAAQKEMLEVEKDLAGFRKQQDDEAKKLTDEKQSAIEKNAADLVKLAEKSVELERANKLAGMDDAGKRDFLRKEREQAMRDQQAASGRGDAKGSLEAGNKAKELTGQIDDITRSIRDKAESDLLSLQSRGPTIATSSLAEIGGGGGARMTESDYGRKTVDLLAIIAANTAGGDTGSKPPEPI